MHSELRFVSQTWLQALRIFPTDYKIMSLGELMRSLDEEFSKRVETGHQNAKLIFLLTHGKTGSHRRQFQSVFNVTAVAMVFVRFINVL